MTRTLLRDAGRESGVSGTDTSAQRFSSVAPETLSRRIVRELIGRIVQGHFRPGDLLPTEEELCHQLGVSRSVVREATKAVTILGMVQSRQGRGTEVQPYDSWNDFAPEVIEARRERNQVDEFLIHLLELRRIVEVEAAGLAAARAGDADREAMRSMVEEMRRVGEDVEAFARLDVAFHDAVIAATGNRPLRNLLRTIEPALLAARTVSLTSRRSGIARSTREHRAIFRAIVEGSGERARSAMARHLSWTANLSIPPQPTPDA